MTTPARPPSHLKAPGKGLWQRILANFILEDHHLVILQAACEAADRGAQARTLLQQSGLTFTDPKGVIHAHPAVSIEKDSRIALLRALRELSLDSSVVEKTTRPARIAGGRRYA